MNTHKTITIAAVALLSVGLMSCAGRRADGTPNGETVEVVLQPTVDACDTLPEGGATPPESVADSSKAVTAQEDLPVSEALPSDGVPGV